MRNITKVLLMFNGLTLLVIVLWLLVGGSRRGYFGGGAAGEVDGILVLFLGAFNVAYLVTVLLVLGSHAAQMEQARARADAGDAGWLDEVLRRQQGVRGFLYNWSLYALAGNGLVILFIGLYLLLNSSGRWDYFQGNATEVDLLLLFVLTVLNILYMGLAMFHFSGTETAPGPRPAPAGVPGPAPQGK
jgi:hypothetical protein